MGGRGAGSLGRGQGGIQQARQLQKNLISAKAQETKAYTKFIEARGAERVTPSDRPDLKKQRREETNKAYEKYSKAKDKRVGIEKQLDKWKRRMKGGSK